MALTLRMVLMTAVPTLAALLGIFWFRKKKKQAIEQPEKPEEREERSGSVPKVILTQPSDEGRRVTELVTTETPLEEIQEVPVSTEINSDEQGTEGNEKSSGVPEITEEIVGKIAEVSVPLSSPTKIMEVCTDHVEEIIEKSEAATILKSNTGSAQPKIKILQRETSVTNNSSMPAENSTSDSPHKDETTSVNKKLVNSEDKMSDSDIKDSVHSHVESISDIERSVEKDSVAQTGVSSNDTKLQADSWKHSDTNNSHIQMDTKSDTKTSHSETDPEMKAIENRKRKLSDNVGSEEEESMSPELAASPVGNCSASTNGSEASVDSGIVATSSHPSSTVYEFNFPTDLCGLLIGARGKNIRKVMDQSGAQIIVKKKVYDPAHQLIVLEGSKTSVERALDIIKNKFPRKKFAGINWGPAPPEHPVLNSEIMQLNLPDGVSVDAIVSSVVALNHIFVQQPTHPSFPMLESQNVQMNMCYTQDGVVPQLPRPIEVGVICAAPMYNGWYRAQVVQSYPDSDEVDLRFVDYGGYCREPGSALRQIRSDFTTLPFQAVECYLANVIPPKNQESFPAEANAVLESMVQGQVVQCEVVGFEQDGVAYIQLYVLRDNKMLLVNRELVNQGVARWIES